ncbi:MAG: hypothetical protein WDZ79_02545 [Candidatus Paceibacterota bacterium]
MNEHPSFSKTWVLITVLVGVVLSIVVALMVFGTKPDAEVPRSTATDTGVDTSEWSTYISDDYHFSIMHPADWEVAEYVPDEDSLGGKAFIVAAVTIYPIESDISPPFDHFADVANVSIYPHGIPTEGVVGEQADTTIAFAPAVAFARDYILEDGSPWATFARFETLPDGWEPYGYIWARAEVHDLTVECRSGGELVSQEKCEPMMGDRLIRTGRVDGEQREIQEVMLESFRFLR